MTPNTKWVNSTGIFHLKTKYLQPCLINKIGFLCVILLFPLMTASEWKSREEKQVWKLQDGCVLTTGAAEMKGFISWHSSFSLVSQIRSCKWLKGFAHFAQLDKSCCSTLRWRITFTSTDIDLLRVARKTWHIVLVQGWRRSQGGGRDKDKEISARWSLLSPTTANIYWIHPLHQALFWAVKKPIAEFSDCK
jgi:hypothetical protein